MTEQRRLNAALAILAVAILAGSGATFAYTSIPKAPVEMVRVNGIEYYWDDIFTEFNVVRFQANGEEYDGVRLSDIVNDSGLAVPASHQYKITSGEDGYSKTVDWGNVLNGYLIQGGKRVVFSDMKTSYWVRQVAEVEAV